MEDQGPEQGQNDSPGIGILVAGAFVGILFCGAFGVSGLFLAGLLKELESLKGGIMFGAIPGLMTGLLASGFVFSIHPPSVRKLPWVSIPFHFLPLVLLPMYVVVNFFAIGGAALGMLLGFLLGPKVVLWWRNRSVDRRNYPPGSWEENF
ncbi:hypothetical protein QPK87_05620 [Kamptonema cortianum]|nr:hypothetical protein [Geitlerinema splendidum]MDK3156055.1 hypothetical protein [Kamptonema cortianum]